MKIICKCGNGLYKQNENGVWCVDCYPEAKGDPCVCGHEIRYLYPRGYTACQMCGIIYKDGEITNGNIDNERGITNDLKIKSNKRGRTKILFGKRYRDTKNGVNR